ncbi:DUF4651 domain-containing protein [Streptococcus himalayensis]|nr:DUF4651 domain-containing protein [Streptococcus himalayensis]
MKAKKMIVSCLAVLSAGTVLYGTYKLTEDQKRVKKQEKLVSEVRYMLSEIGEIETFYVQLYQSNEDCLVGGAIFSDGRELTFRYEKGELTYEERR